jgi:exopolysaccharide biosynthesis protein
MAYQPKYSQKKPSRQETPTQPVKKMSRGVLILFVILGVIIVPAASFFTGKLLLAMAQDLGRPKTAAVKTTGDMTILQSFEEQMAERLNGTRQALTTVEKPDIPAEDPVEVAPVRKRYWIEADALVAAEPNQEKFGKSNDPEVLNQVLHEARWLLDGQKMYFSTDRERYSESIVNYYLDDSILAITWQEVHDGSVYTFSEIKVSDPSQFRRHLADGEYGSDKQYETTEMAAAVNAVVASAGDFYRFRDFGAVVYKGEAKRVEGTYAETCYIDSKGDMHFTYAGEVLNVKQVQEFVDEHDIQFSLAFGPILVHNGAVIDHTWYGVGEITEGYARSALCQMDELHYIVVTANTTGVYQQIPTVAQFAKNVAATGCIHAYCLDGGQTATIVMNDKLMNRPVYGQQRKISDIIYFATAVPEGGSDNG